MQHGKKFIPLILVILVSTGCASYQDPEKDPNAWGSHKPKAQEIEKQEKQAEKPGEIDPFESMNRAIFSVNKLADKVIIRPVALGYSKILPKTIQVGVSNFFDNLRDVSTSANDILQWKWGQFVNDASRVVINSTIGLAGFFDPATLMGLPQHKEDFGQTLAYWGYENSAYIVLPILGPSTIRDTIGMSADFYALSVWPYIESDSLRYTLLALDLTDYRVKELQNENTIKAVAMDEYVFIRNAYLQHRKFLYSDGKISEDPLEEPDDLPSNLSDEDKTKV